MNLYLVPKQRGLFARFERFLRVEIPIFVRRHRTVCLALIKHGMLTKLIDSIPDFHNQGVLPDTFAKRRAILDKALRWGTPPKVIVGGRNMFIGGNSGGGWWGAYNPVTDMITLYKPLVEQWQMNPRDKILYRAMVAVVLHELVHFFNDQVLPGSKVNAEPGHLKTFHKEAFEKPPLGWERAHHTPITEILRNKGVH